MSSQHLNTPERPSSLLTLSRRSALSAGVGGVLGASQILTGNTAPYVISSESERPVALWGTMVSEVTAKGAIIWSRADHPSEMIVTWSTDPDFKVKKRMPPAKALPDSDCTARILLDNLPSGRRIFYIVHFESLRYDQVRSLPIFGEFSTPPADAYSPVRIAWSGDSFGQGYGINPQFGAVRNIYTPTNGHKIDGLEQIENNMNLVAGGMERFRRLG